MRTIDAPRLISYGTTVIQAYWQAKKSVNLDHWWCCKLDKEISTNRSSSQAPGGSDGTFTSQGYGRLRRMTKRAMQKLSWRNQNDKDSDWGTIPSTANRSVRFCPMSRQSSVAALEIGRIGVLAGLLAVTLLLWGRGASPRHGCRRRVDHRH